MLELPKFRDYHAIATSILFTGSISILAYSNFGIKVKGKRSGFI